MANQNLTQLTYQTGSADPTTLLYSVTGNANDRTLPLTVLFNNAQFTGTVVIPTLTLSGGTINGTSVGATTQSTGSFTTLAASSTISGAGFSTYLASPPAIGGTAAAAGSFTTLSSTGNFTPSQTNGIIGTTTNNNANAGSIGEYQTNSTTGTSMTTNTGVNATSISLTAGDWDVWGVVTFLPAGTPTQIVAGVNTTSATLPAVFQALAMTMPAASNQNLLAPTVRISLASTTTVFLVAQSAFSSTQTCNGIIFARRRR